MERQARHKNALASPGREAAARGDTQLPPSIADSHEKASVLHLETAAEAVNRRAPARYSPSGRNPALEAVQEEYAPHVLRGCGSRWLSQERETAQGSEARAVVLGCSDRIRCYRCSSAYSRSQAREAWSVVEAQLEHGAKFGGLALEFTLPRSTSEELDALREEAPGKWKKALGLLMGAVWECVRRLWRTKHGQEWYAASSTEHKGRGKWEEQEAGGYVRLQVNSSGKPWEAHYHFHVHVLPLDSSGHELRHFWPREEFGPLSAALRAEWYTRAATALRKGAGIILTHDTSTALTGTEAAGGDGSEASPEGQLVVHLAYLPARPGRIRHRLRYDLRSSVADMGDGLRFSPSGGLQYRHRDAHGVEHVSECTPAQVAEAWTREEEARHMLKTLRYYGYLSNNRRGAALERFGLERVPEEQEQEAGEWHTVDALELVSVEEAGIVLASITTGEVRLWPWAQVSYSTPGGRRKWRKRQEE